MAISTITQQPANDSLWPTMRPIIFQVTTITSVPMVMADIYINAQYIGTYQATAPILSTLTLLTWEFDIRGICWRFFKDSSKPGSYGGTTIKQAGASSRVYVKFRDSSTIGGVVVPEGPEPIQAIGLSLAVPGGGTSSNTFWTFLSTSQHENNRDFEAHLRNQRKGSYNNTAFPLSHRPEQYQTQPGATDYFPFAIKEEVLFGSITIDYLRFGRVTWEQATYTIPQPPPTCNATIISAYITTNSSGQATVTYTMAGADQLYWSNPFVSAGVPQGPVLSSPFTIPPMVPGNYIVKLIPRCSNGISGTEFSLGYTVTARTTAWRGRASDAFCMLDTNGDNIGFLSYQTLEQVFTDVTPNVPTGTTKPNDPADPDYYPNTYDAVTCPLPGGGLAPSRSVLGLAASTLMDVCGVFTGTYYISTIYFGVSGGVQVFNDAGMVNAIIGTSYFRDSHGTIWEVDPATGTITNLTTYTC